MSLEVIYSLYIDGVPKAQPRPRMTKHGHVYNPDTAKDWKKTVQGAFLLHRKPVILNPCTVEIIFYLRMPKARQSEALYLPHTAKPDGDNLEKAVWDALTEIGVWKDDSLIWKHSSEKLYSCVEEGAKITIKTFV